MPTQSQQAQTIRVFIVEDDAIFANYIRCLLSDIGFKSELSTSAEMAMENLSQDRRYHLALLDINLPGKSGIELAQEMKSCTELMDIPIIFLTSLNEHEKIVQSYDIGALDYITKPINAEQFRAKLLSLSSCLLDHQQFKLSADKYQYLFNKLQNVILSCNDGLIEVNNRLEVDFVNPAATKMLDLAPISYEGQNIKQIICYEELLNLCLLYTSPSPRD